VRKQWDVGERTALSSGERPQRVCLLTGAAGTFGQEFCRRNADGYSIAAVYHHTAPALASQETTFFDPLGLTAPVPENDPVFAIQADLSTPAGCEWAVRAALGRFRCIDVVVHAAVHSVWGVLDGNGRSPARRSNSQSTSEERENAGRTGG
jgi:NAD(P)-dependent dehydrogenase (short-subunit alcohol dehydrogenase family)